MPSRTIRAVLVLLAFRAATLAAQSPITLPGNFVFPENLSSDRAGNIYVGNLGMGGVYRIKANSTAVESWIAPAAYGTAGILGVLADDRSNTLWLCSNDLTDWGAPVKGGDKASTLKGFDLTTGQGKISVPLPTRGALCNDITIGPDGAAYVSNSNQPEILRLAPGASSFEIWFSDPSLALPAGKAGLDGLAFGADGNLYVDRYDPADLYRIDVGNGKAVKATRLIPSRKLTPTDAIRRLGGATFLMVEGGGSVDRMTIRGDSAIIETLQDGFDIPTSATLVGKTVWVSESHFDWLDPKKKGQTPPPFRIYPVPLK